ncbi:hypothetical protein EST38_g2731 [Candolleomyces aberdarensis]|uniref:Protein kinase domain-containing protein n=1 Tax=Candolleomyces aberdarensis TaxID=2316362 RepID=A0A4Q2DVA5_9AGAR|nr:hypothetical protein EST38_g2731 [Candolleomyces aberdarensis]
MDVQLTIPFPFPLKVQDLLGNEEEFDAMLAERFKFWDTESTFLWFKSRGYTLYQAVRTDPTCLYYDPTSSTTLPRIPSERIVNASYPWPHHDDFLNREAEQYSGNVVFAQDDLGRHVAIKLVPEDDSDELKLYQIIKQESLETLKENRILPVLDLLPVPGYCFVVMPRWGSAPFCPDLETAEEVLDVMRSMLRQALVFLHERRIIHRDIWSENFLVNHFSGEPILNDHRKRLRRRGQLMYAIYDYDLSTIAPEGVKIGEFRMPYQMSWWGHFWRPFDTKQGEPDYDPFAFDVGTLGNVLCSQYQHVCQDVYFLAPLLDMMVTRDIPKRFTARQALDFLEDRVSEMSPRELKKPIKPGDIEARSRVYDQYDRWQRLPPNFVQKWGHFREPPIPLMTKFLRWVYSFACMKHFLPRLRKFLQI